MAIFGGKIINIVFFFFYMASIRWQHPFFLCIELFFRRKSEGACLFFPFPVFYFFFFFNGTFFFTEEKFRLSSDFISVK